MVGVLEGHLDKPGYLLVSARVGSAGRTGMHESWSEEQPNRGSRGHPDWVTMFASVYKCWARVRLIHLPALVRTGAGG